MMETTNTVLLAALVVLALSGLASLEGLKRRLAAAERKLHAVGAALGLPAEPAPSDEVQRLARSGEKIAAIEAYREATGAGLAEAKAAVERIAGGLVTCEVARQERPLASMKLWLFAPGGCHGLATPANVASARGERIRKLPAQPVWHFLVISPRVRAVHHCAMGMTSEFIRMSQVANDRLPRQILTHTCGRRIACSPFARADYGRA
jgi:ribosomal protein L7/L12